MDVIKQEFTVKYSYPVYFTSGLFETGNLCLRDFFTGGNHRDVRRKALFVLDEGLLPHYPNLEERIRYYFEEVPGVECVSHVLRVPGGEEVKNSSPDLREILTLVNLYSLDRHSYIVAVGGGAVLDMAGYAAAIAHRGIKHIRIPTTVLSQNDSGVGVKNAINYFGKKNFIGTFAPPVAVFNDYDFLSTLDARDWRSGIAEAIKVALIRDAAFFDWIEKHADELVNREEKAIRYLVYRCAQLHLQHIAEGDPFENGSSRPLDFGHWSAHKLEQLTDFELRHGEAVAIGMALDVVYSFLIGWLDKAEEERILRLLTRLQFNLWHPALTKPALFEGIDEFREHLGGRLTIMLLEKIGEGKNIHEMDKEKIRTAIEMLNVKQKM